MKKKIIIGSIIGAAVIGLAGCGASGSATETTTTTTTAAETETTTKATESTTAKETETTTKATESTTASTEATTESSATESTTEKIYSLNIKKAADGFEKTGDLTYESSNAKYTYSVLNDVTNHTIESKLDEEALNLSDVDLGRIGDALYAKGKTDSGYTVVAYKYLGAGTSVSSFAGIEYLSEADIKAEDVCNLLYDDYIEAK